MFTPVLIYVLKSFVGFRWFLGVSDVKVYEVGRYYTVLLENLAPGRNNYEHFLNFVEVLGRVKGATYHAYISNFMEIGESGKILEGPGMGFGLKGWNPAENNAGPNGIRIDQYATVRDEYNGAQKTGHLFDWYILPEELDHDSLAGKFRIEGPYGTYGFYEGNLQELVNFVKGFSQQWEKEVWVVSPPDRWGEVERRAMLSEERRKLLGTHIVKYGQGVLFPGTRPEKKLPRLLDESKVIRTRHFQSWKVVSLMAGLGFEHYREEDEDVFVSHAEVEYLPARGDLVAVRFVHHEGYDNVLVFWANSSNRDQLFSIAGLSSYGDWKMMVEDDLEGYGIDHWLEYNGVTIR